MSNIDPHYQAQEMIRDECQKLADFLVAKNKAYGNSALCPIGIFAKGDPQELIRVRIDDKLNRLRNSPHAFNEDTVLDLLGYLILLRVSRRMTQTSATSV